MQAEAEAESIIKVAKARRKEAEELTATKIAEDLATIRVMGEAGEKIFQGGSNNFVYAKDPGDVLFGLMRSLTGKQ